MSSAEITRLHAADLAGAGTAFQRDGALVVDNVFSPRRLQEIHDRLIADHPEFVGKGLPSDRKDLGEGRFIAPIPLSATFDCSDLLSNPILIELLTAILDPDFVFEAFGVISSLPGCREQQIHFDGGLLFPRIGIDNILPAPAVTLVIPLVRMDLDTGTTALWLGSHRSTGSLRVEEPIAPIINVGSIALWDFRLRHRGLANQSGRARPLLYVTACHPFWIDHKNFERGKNAKLLLSKEVLMKMSADLRPRFVRADLIGRV